MNRRKKLAPIDANSLLPREINSRVRNSIARLILTNRDEPEFFYLGQYINSKYTDLDTTTAADRRIRAIRKWFACERDNEATNVRLLTVPDDFKIAGVPYDRFMSKVRSIVSDVIGDVPPPEVSLGSFSGGASTSKRRLNGHPSIKYLEKADVSNRCLSYFQELVLEEDCLWKEHVSNSGYRVVDYNILFTVPKSSEIDRCCAMEPDLNMYLQKGVGDFIRKRLKHFNVNLNDQTRNQRSARQGSIDGSLATIDLSSASDTVCKEFVFQALPVCWYTYLDAIRSDKTLVDGTLHTNQMFSSMGNGFTFELESLLFYSIARAVAYFEGQRGLISVYGDDIIVPVTIAPQLVEWLDFLGFSVNLEKSYWSGPFRESCGKFWHNGIDVTPFYLRRPINRLFDLTHFLNSLVKWATVDDMVDPRIWPVWNEFRHYIPKRLWGGQDLSDPSALVDGSAPRYKLVPIQKDKRHDHIGGYLNWLRSCFDRDVSSCVTTSLGSVPHGRYRIVRNRTVSRISVSFPDEREHEIQALPITVGPGL